MNSFQILQKQELNSARNIYQQMNIVLENTGRLLILLDETLQPGVFDDLKKSLKVDNIIFIPLAKGEQVKNTKLFFIEITRKEDLEKVGLELAEYMTKNFEIQNHEYLVHGFGTSILKNDEINHKFKKSLVLQDINSKVLFRWFDARVMIYLDDIFTQKELNSLFAIFEKWNFIHSSGYFSWEKNKQEKFIVHAIRKLTEQQSLKLDLIEISNLILKETIKYKEIDTQYIKPKQILENLHDAYENHQIRIYSDLFGYGLYAEILGKHFFIHPDIQQILNKYWQVQPDNYSFTEAMDFLDLECWTYIKSDLNLLESIANG